MSPGSSTKSCPAFAHIGLRETPEKPQPGYDGWINFENETQDRQEWRNAICEREEKDSGFSYDLLHGARTTFRGMVLREQPGEYCRRNGRTYSYYEHVVVSAPKFLQLECSNLNFYLYKYLDSFTDSLNGISVPYILIGDKFGMDFTLFKHEKQRSGSEVVIGMVIAMRSSSTTSENEACKFSDRRNCNSLTASLIFLNSRVRYNTVEDRKHCLLLLPRPEFDDTKRKIKTNHFTRISTREKLYPYNKTEPLDSWNDCRCIINCIISDYRYKGTKFDYRTDRLDTATCTHTLLSTDVHIRTDHVRYTLRYLHCFSLVSCPHPSYSALNAILTNKDSYGTAIFNRCAAKDTLVCREKVKMVNVVVGKLKSWQNMILRVPDELQNLEHEALKFYIGIGHIKNFIPVYIKVMQRSQIGGLDYANRLRYL
ncbi:hypothetical protein ANN_10792 [Periplaneta americana]|uniref:Uncharacterized protein n=1 Tax=Periplaneta americana TaxID=6978 RepID=A0ABQ8T4R4_PERAM|nr:hypothetical protein ANN_10792 [Periplaneta americana]